MADAFLRNSLASFRSALLLGSCAVLPSFLQEGSTSAHTVITHGIYKQAAVFVMIDPYLND
jgi:hypothetical protein